SATATAEAIRAAIRAETRLTASAGVAPNKFLAKIASDFRKPDGLFVVRPREVMDFLTPLSVARLPGVGKVMEGRLAALGVITVGELRTVPAEEMEQRFGRWGRRLHELSLGIDEHPVQPDRPTLQVSAEDTFENDLPLDELEPHIRRLAEKAWAGHQREVEGGRVARTVVLKLKTSDFHTLTRSLTPDAATRLRARAGRHRLRPARPRGTSGEYPLSAGRGGGVRLCRGRQLCRPARPVRPPLSPRDHAAGYFFDPKAGTAQGFRPARDAGKTPITRRQAPCHGTSGRARPRLHIGWKPLPRLIPGRFHRPDSHCMAPCRASPGHPRHPSFGAAPTSRLSPARART
ncbi:DNA polymerase IV, partial [Rhodanobacter sp. 115]